MQQHKNCDLILNDRGTLWLGDLDSARNIEFLKSKNIRTVITVAAGFDIKLEGIIQHKINILDIQTENILQYFQTAIEWIERGFNIGNVLVHCMAGISRSATIVIAYLIEKKKMGFQEALNFVKSKRPQVNPNIGFTNQLKSFALKKQPPLPNTNRNNHFQLNQDYYGKNTQAVPFNRKGSAGCVQQDINFYKSITKSMSQSKNKNK